MTDDALALAFEAGELPAGTFDQEAHVRVAYAYLRRLPFLEACVAMREGLKRFAARIGKPNLYHETITVAFMSLVNERMLGDRAADGAEFLCAHPELADRALLERYYDAATLHSDAARRAFLLGRRQRSGRVRTAATK